MYEFGKIVLVEFPFTDWSYTKLRPALIISKKPMGRDVMVAFITSSGKGQVKNGLKLDGNNSTGLKAPSLVRFDKIATLDKKIIKGELGEVKPAALAGNRKAFLSVFGF